ncbi:MAG TPA: PQQ-binding-like beta-propeller repeat protein, partial [Actinomycetota bacterium]
AATPAALAQATATWSQTQGSAAHTGVGDGPEPPFAEAWRAEQPSSGPGSQYGLSAPIVVGDEAVAVGPRALVGISLHDGSVTWTVDRRFGPSVAPAAASVRGRTLVLFTEGFGTGPPSASPTPSPSPSPSSDDEGEQPPSFLTAIDAATQRPAWEAPVRLEAVSRSGVTVDGGTAFLADRLGTVVAVDAADGEVIWSEDAGGPITAPLAVGDGTVVATVEGNRTTRARLVAFDAATGEVDWRHEVAGSAVFGSAPSIGEGAIYVGFSDQTVRRFDLGDGTQGWATRVNGLAFVGIPAVTPDAVVVVDAAGQVYRIDPTTGARTWDFALNELVVRSSAVVVGDHVLVATVGGDLAAIGLDDGRLVWRRGERGPVLRNLAPAGDVIVGVQGGPHAGLIAFAHDPDGELVSVVSPTELDPASLIVNYLIAAVPLALVLLLLGRWLRGRMGPAFLDDEVQPGLDPVEVALQGGEDA